MSDAPWKGPAVVALIGVVGAGAGVTAWQTKRAESAHESALTASREELAACAAARDDARASEARTKAEAEASLDTSRAELADLRAEHAEAEQRLAAFKALTEKFRKMIDSGKLQVVLRHGRMVVKLPAGVLFASGSADLSKDGEATLKDVAGVLKQVTDRRFMVAGHTDNVPVAPTTPFKNNLELSTARALVVAQRLIGAGMPGSRLVAAGYAEHEPVRENSNEAGRQENRRIEIVLMPHLTELPALPGDPKDAGAPDAHR